MDAHVHYYPRFGWGRFLDGAAANLRRAGAGLGLEGGEARLLLFVESHGHQAFEQLQRQAEARVADGWRVRPTGDDAALRLVRDDGFDLFVLAGRQIECREGLEVLALTCGEALPDGEPVRQTLRKVAAAGAIGVLPWGFGKWWLRRGRVVRELLEEEPGEHFFVGDNGGRPALSPRPPLFDLAAARGRRLLPGSDPLRLSWHAARAGRYGFVLDGWIGGDRPASWLKEALGGLDRDPLPFGRRESLLGFAISQAAVHLRRLGTRLS